MSVKCQSATCAPQQNSPLFDHLVGADEKRWRNGQADRFSCGQVDNEIELGRLLDRKVGGLRPSQNFVDEVSGASEQVRIVWSIRHKTSRFDELLTVVNR